MIILGIANIQLIVVVVLSMTCVGLATWGILSIREPNQTAIDRRLHKMDEQPTQKPSQPDTTVLRMKSSATLVNKMSVLSKPLETSDLERNKLVLRLAQAGIRRESAATLFLGAKMILLSFGTLASWLFAWSGGHGGKELFCIVIIGSAIGFMIPNIWLSLMRARRIERISLALADSLDMLVIAVEAGLGLDAAIQRVANEMRRTHPELAEEWTISSREAQMGVVRAEAMRRMAERSALAEMRSLVAVLIQSERLGTSIAQTLRVHAETLRTKRRQKAEERAARTSIILLIPLLLFLFPVIFIVLLGPAIIKVKESGMF